MFSRYMMVFNCNGDTMPSIALVNEGYFIVTEEGLVFEVKGIVHPEDRYIAYLRYIPDEFGDRQSMGRKYSKIYDIKEREKFLSRNYDHFLWLDPYSNRLLQAVPIDKIDFILNPIDALRHMRDKGSHLSNLEQKTVNLVNSFLDLARMKESSIGITGSQLVGLSNLESDIDLVVYGESDCRSLYNSLRENWDSIQGMEKYEGRLLKRHVEFRWGKNNRWLRWLCQREQSKLLQGIYDNSDFFIRMVKNPNEVEWKYGERIHTYLGEKIVQCLVTDDSQGIFTPCEYSVDCEQRPNLRGIVSFRGRFTEHIDKGMQVEAKGRMEQIQDREGHEFQYLIVGEQSSDYIIPIEYL